MSLEDATGLSRAIGGIPVSADCRQRKSRKLKQGKEFHISSMVKRHFLASIAGAHSLKIY